VAFLRYSNYLDAVWRIYEGRVAGGADFVTYWFEKARAQIENNKTKRAGLIATNSIRGGASRQVLSRIKDSGDIFLGHSDRAWTLEGAAVRVSIVGFDDGSEETKTLDALPVKQIHSDLTSDIDLSIAKNLLENHDLSLRGNEKHGAFDIPQELAQEMIKAKNKSGKNNADVIAPYVNGSDIVRGNRNMWIIDFFDMPLEEAEKYEAPIKYIRKHVKPVRDNNNRASRRERWWQHGELARGLRTAIKDLRRFIVTPAVSKHRVFTWMDATILPDHKLYAFAREDDYFFGVLHSKLHETWSLRQGSTLEDRPAYTSTTTFETFPFPWSPGSEPTNNAHYKAIAAAAKALHTEREAWLNPAQLPKDPQTREAVLSKRTLTNLYNALQEHRGLATRGRIPTEAKTFAPRLAKLHDDLDKAVVAAYGWEPAILEDEESMLRALLTLNLDRAAAQDAEDDADEPSEEEVL